MSMDSGMFLKAKKLTSVGEDFQNIALIPAYAHEGWVYDEAIQVGWSSLRAPD